jgi:hypothetical protein
VGRERERDRYRHREENERDVHRDKQINRQTKIAETDI